jgi:hypothetical protein
MAVVPTEDWENYGKKGLHYRLPMCNLLAPYVGMRNATVNPGSYIRSEVFHCKSDTLEDTKGLTKKPTTETSWYEFEGASYEPRTFLSILDSNGYLQLSREFQPLGKDVLQSGGVTGKDKEIQEMYDLFDNLSKLSLVWDYENLRRPNQKG